MRGLFALILAVGLGGCIASQSSVVENVNASGWRETKEITMMNSDTVTLRDLDIFMRYHPTLSPISFNISIESIAPDSTSCVEEITIYLDTSPDGRGVAKLSSHPYRKDVLWRQVGEYRLLITPTTTVEGIEAIGVNVKSSE